MADQVIMSNIAQTINVLQAMILTKEDLMLLTPTYHVYNMYKHHQGADSLRLLIHGPEIDFTSNGEQYSLPAVAGSASLKDRTVFLSLTNSHAKDKAQLGEHQDQRGVSVGADGKRHSRSQYLRKSGGSKARARENRRKRYR
jgi:alpha-L-arabinofuranosidase